MNRVRDKFWSIGIPLALGLGLLGVWQAAVVIHEPPAFLLPAPIAVLREFTVGGRSFVGPLVLTLSLTIIAFLLAVVSGVVAAILVTQSKVVERAVYPYAIILQITPLVAMAPLITIWTGEHDRLGIIIMAWLVAFFPVLSNLTIGLRSADRNLKELFQLYSATRWQRLWRLDFPAALPHFFSGLKIASGLALVGTIVAELTGGSGNAIGLGWLLSEAMGQIKAARMLAVLIILSAIGVGMFGAVAALQHLVLRRWHESALPDSR